MIQIKKQKCEQEYGAMSFDEILRKQGFQKFKQAELYLSEDYEPEKILCRDQQMKRITIFIENFMVQPYAKESLYIAGVPGIGKTLSVNKVVQQFKCKQESKKAKLKFVKLNAMNLKKPSDIYKNLYNGLIEHTSKPKKSKISSYSSLIKLDGIFRNQQPMEDQIDEQIKEMKKVVIIDQIDYLKTKDEEVLYNIFDWTQSENSKLAIIAISNTFDFPERLMQKIMSRIGNNRLPFRPYKCEELQEILSQRVESTEVFEKNVLSLISKRIAKCSSDIRKCFQTLKDAIYLHVKQMQSKNLKNTRISSEKVSQAHDEIYNDNFNEIYRAMPRIYQQVLIIMGQYFVRDTKMLALENMCSIAENKYKLQADEVREVLMAMADYGLVECKYGLNPSAGFRLLRKWNYRLKIPADKILYAALKYTDDSVI